MVCELCAGDDSCFRVFEEMRENGIRIIQIRGYQGLNQNLDAVLRKKSA